MGIWAGLSRRSVGGAFFGSGLCSRGSRFGAALLCLGFMKRRLPGSGCGFLLSVR